MSGESYMRKIAIQLMPDDSLSNVVGLLEDFSKYGFSGSMMLFNCSKKAIDAKDIGNVGCQIIDCPDSCDNNSKAKNFIFDTLQAQDGFRFLHIIEGNTKLLKDPTAYINEVEKTMDVLDYSIYFSTSSDRCNYVFSKFSPRLTIDIDDENVNKKLSLPPSLSFTSHSNTVWTIYDCEKCSKNIQRYDEKFSIAMFMIIEYLARRRSNKRPDQLYYMNQYLSVPSELGVFTVIENAQNGIDPKKMQEEDAMFKSMKINYAPDNNLDVVLDALYMKLKGKTNA